MNIVFFCRYFYPHIGGVEKHVLKISQQLLANHTVTVITEQHDLSLPLVDYYRGITIYRLPYIVDSKEKKYRIWNYLFENKSIFKNADIIHIHDVFYWYFPFRFMYPSKKVFMTFHGYEGNSLPSYKAILSHKIAEILTHGNICVGDYLSKWYHTKADIVTYGAVDTPPKVTKHTKLISNSKEIRILYIGRLEKEAGIEAYLTLLFRLVKKNYKVRLTVLGNGSLRNWSEKYVRMHRLPVRFEGFVTDVEPYLPSHDVVFTSRFLGTMEALTYKRPVFCIYNNAIKRDCFEMAPFAKNIFLSDDIRVLENEFIQMLEDQDQTRQKIEKSYNLVKHETWKKMASQYERLWAR